MSKLKTKSQSSVFACLCHFLSLKVQWKKTKQKPKSTNFCICRYQLCSLVGWSIPWGRGWAQAVGAGHRADGLQTDGCVLVLSPLPHQDESTGQSEHQDPISLAVEMAAVNHSILVLAQRGRGGNEVKAEVLDDD